ncbi:MAG: putative Ig domain-containing protein [Planctomycetota bacterium]|jgi:parallel beta-helix repeat protein
MKMCKLLCAVVITAVLCAAAYPATYYVSTSGDDGDSGSSSYPWATLQHAVDTISAGDTIIVNAGTYDGCRIESSGSSGSIKTLKAASSATVILDAPSNDATHNGILEIENYSGTVSYWEIDGFELDGGSETYRCIDLRDTSHITIKNCEVYEAYMTGIFAAFSYNVLIEDNVSYNNGEHGIYCNNSSDNGTIRANTVYSNSGCGIHMNGDESMGGDGVMSYWLVEYNVSYLNPSGSAINCDGVCDSEIFNNLLYDNTGSGISLYAIDGAEGSSDNLVYNNTVVMPSNGRWALNIPASSGGPSSPTGNKIKNNILYNASSTEGSITTYSSSVTGFESDYNVVISRFSINDDTSNISLSTWQGYGYDTNSITSTPSSLFTDAGNDDYTLKSGSPAIDAGTTLNDITDDIDGLGRPQGSYYDIGCYEYESGYADLEITTTSLPGGTVSVSYSQTVSATGGKTPYSWSVISGSLPSGLSLGSSTGTISGTPTSSGTSNFTVQVTDDQSPADSDTQALSIVISSGGQTEKTYQQGLDSYTGWDDSWITEDDPNTNFETMTSAHLQYNTQDRQLHLMDLSDIPSSATIDEAIFSFYNYQNSGTSVCAAYRIITDWDVSEVTYNNAKSGTSWGTAGMQSGTDYASTAAGTSSSISSVGWVTIDITDLVQDWVDGTYTNRGVMLRLTSGGHPRTRMADYSTQSDRPKLEVTYTSGAPANLEITTTSLPDGQQGVSYSQTVSATGGETPYTWSIDSGSLPAGLSLGSSTGTISGTPSSYGTSNFTVKVTDDQSPADTDTQALSITVDPEDVEITTTSLPDGDQGVSYSQTVSATGGDTPYTWSIDSGSLPAGLSLGSSTGTISGTPTSYGTSNFTVKVTDDWSPANTDTQALSITVDPEDVEITTTSLPDGDQGVSYSQTVQATGGDTPYTWSIDSGSLPAGLSLGSSTGTISGTPTSYGTSNFTVKVTDDWSPANTDTQALSIYVAPEGVEITTTSLPDGTVDTAYSQTVQATGGETPYTWSVYSGSLPTGLSLNSSTGVISGTPTTANTYNFTIQVSDDQSPADTDTQALSITIGSGGPTEVTFQQGLDSYTGWDDSWITEDNPNTNYETMTSAHLQYYTQDRQLHLMDLSSIPSTATITEAIFSFYNYQNAGTSVCAAYRIITDWDVSEVTYNNAKSGTSWGTAGMQSGTDYASTAAGTSSSITSAGWVTIDITDLVQDWVDGTYTNRGVVLRLTSGGHPRTRMADYSTQSYRPKLEVTYTD